MTSPISIFIPVYNEEELLFPNTERLRDYLTAHHIPFEIIIGSNGSRDKTSDVGMVLQSRYPEVRFFHLPQRGPGTALRKALDLMRYDRMICLDMDLSVDLAFIAEAARLLEDYEIVVGSKKLGVEVRSLYRRLGSDLFIALSKKLLRLPYDDFSIGAKAYRKAVLGRYADVIRAGTFYVHHIIYLAHRDGVPMIQIPVRCDDHRSSRFNMAREGLERFSRLFLLWFRQCSFSHSLRK